MISARTFDNIYAMCKIKDTGICFGGMQVIFTGDFFQLPPVPSPEYNDDGKYCFESKYFWKAFPHRVLLSQIIRQSELPLIKAVNEIYQGELTPESLDFIMRLNRPLHEGAGHSFKLFSKNEYVDDFNRSCLLDFPGDIHEFLSLDTGSDLSKLSKITAPHTLWLKKGCPVTLLRNLSDSLVNGLCGTVEDIDQAGPVIRFQSLDMVTRVPKVKFSGNYIHQQISW